MVAQDAVSASPLARQQALEYASLLVQPAVLGGRLEHRIFATDLIDVGGHLEFVLDAPNDVEVGHAGLDHHHV